MNIFGFEIKYKKKEEERDSVLIPNSSDGATVLSSAAAAYYGTAIDMDTSFKNESDMIRRYREISLQPECDSAIEEITNEVISNDSKGEIVKLNLEDLKVSEAIKKKVQEEFKEILYLFDFDERAPELFKKWYIDGRQYHIVTVDVDKPKEGIKKIELVDSRKIRKIKKIEKKRDPVTGVDLVKNVEEFFIYNERGVDNSSVNHTTGVKLSIDSILYCPSGNFDQNNNMMYSYLHKALKPVNQLKMMEDALVIYRIARAPERRIFYIDVGNLPKVKAEQYITDIMNKYKNKIVYDPSTGEVKDSTKHMSMLEDFYLARREGSKGTEIQTLPSGQSLNQLDDVEYFKQKVYQSLNVPISRLQPQQNFSLGRSNEITRDELKFNKFTKRLRNKFSSLIIDALKIQLILKNVVSADDWKDIEKKINVSFIEDNNFVELKENELWLGRFSMLQQVDPYVGKYFSEKWIKKNILKFTEEEQKELEKEIADMPVPDEQTNIQNGE